MTAVVICCAIASLFVWALCSIAGRSDERMERIMADFANKRRNQNGTNPVLAEVSEMAEGASHSGGIAGSEVGVVWEPNPATIGRGEGTNREVIPNITTALPGADQTRGPSLRSWRDVMMPVWPAVVVIAFILGCVAGWAVRLHSVSDRYHLSLAAKYQAQQIWLDAQTAMAIADVERDVATVKAQLKKTSKEVKRHGK